MTNIFPTDYTTKTTPDGTDVVFSSDALANFNLTVASIALYTLTNSTTDDITEGNTNLYYTEARVSNNSTVVDLVNNKADKSSIEPLLIPGEIRIWPTSIAPTGFLVCDGSAVSRTTYSDLFAVIGTTYGNGDGTTTFNIPDIKGKVVSGYDPSQNEFNGLGKTGGEKTHTLTTSEIPSHTHNMEVVYPAFLPNGDGNDKGGGGGADARGTQTSDGGTGGGQAHNNLQPYITLNYIIKF